MLDGQFLKVQQANHRARRGDSLGGYSMETAGPGPSNACEDRTLLHSSLNFHKNLPNAASEDE